MKKTNFTFHKQYSFGLLFSMNVLKRLILTKIFYNAITLSEKKELT